MKGLTEWEWMVEVQEAGSAFPDVSWIGVPEETFEAAVKTAADRATYDDVEEVRILRRSPDGRKTATVATFWYCGDSPVWD